MALNNPPRIYDLSDSPSNGPVTLSREPSLKRGRGLSTSSKKSLDLHHQRSLRTFSPLAETVLESPRSSRPSFELNPSRRPSKSRNHGRQTPTGPESRDSPNYIDATVPNSCLSTSPSRYSSGDYHGSIADKPASPDVSQLGTLHSPKVSPDESASTSKNLISESSITRGRSETGLADGDANLKNTGRVPGTKILNEPQFQSQPEQLGQQQQNLGSIGEMALEHLFFAFESQATQKISQYTALSLSLLEPQVELICGPRADPNFDQLLSALGRLVRKFPKPLVDRLMRWRNHHYELRSLASPSISAAEDQNTEHSQGLSDLQTSTASTPSAFSGTPFYSNGLTPAGRKSSVATYILCRLLIEIYRQTDLISLTPEISYKLEDIVWNNQLKSVAREVLERSPLMLAKWNMVTQLLGAMGELNFGGVSSRFLADFKACQKILGVKGYTNKDVESEADLVMKGMRYLRLQSHSEASWARSCTFANSIADLFSSVHGQAPKISYCRLVGTMLLPLAGTNVINFDRPVWKRVIYIIQEKLSELLIKPKYWQTAFPVQAILACVSPYDHLVPKWQQLLLTLPSKLRERHNRATALKATCRMLWAYLHTTRDAQNTVTKTLEDVTRVVFFSGKRYSLSTDPAIAESLIQLIRIIGFHRQDFCFQTIIFPLVNAELFSSTKELKVDILEPDRIVIAIRAFLAIMSDLGKKEKPPFPFDFADERLDESSNGPSSVSKSKLRDRTPSDVKVERLSCPVMTKDFADETREYYNRFCDILGNIIIICDDSFGGKAVLNERFGIPIPKTPTADAWTFSRKDDSFNNAEERYGFYDLLHVAIQALPRCLSGRTPLNSLLSILCTGTAHVDKNIADSSVNSLKSLARQGHAQLVTARLSEFILKYDNRYSTMSDGGLLGPDHMESTLKLYLELLQVWNNDLEAKTDKVVHVQPAESLETRSGQLDASATWIQVDRVESHGLLFLASPSHRVRSLAVEILRLVSTIDNTLGQSNARIIHVLDGSSQTIMNADDENLTVAERSFLQRGMRKSNTLSTLVDLCNSDEERNVILWYKVFPNLIRVAFELCPMAVTQAREDICARLSQMHTTVQSLDDRFRSQQPYIVDFTSTRATSRLLDASADVTVEQWKLYLIFACSTMTKTGGSQQAVKEELHHTRQSSRSSQSTQDSFSTATDLFIKVLPMLSAMNPSIRNAAAIGLGSINVNLYKPLLEALESAAQSLSDVYKKFPSSHQRAASSPRRQDSNEHFRPELAQVYKLTSHFLQSAEANKDDWVLGRVATYTTELRLFLQRGENEPHNQRLRLQYCGLVEGFFIGINKTSDPSRWMTFQNRRAAFTLLEEWCGYSSGHDISVQPGIATGRHHNGKLTTRAPRAATIEIEKRDLKAAALSAMATLCGGPLRIQTKTGVLEFNIERMLVWIDKIFKTESDKTHATGRRALKTLILHNRHYNSLLERPIDMLYLATSYKALESYVDVISDVLLGDTGPAVPIWRILSALIFILGNNHSNIRLKAARLLRHLDERNRRGSKLQDLEISISDQTTAVNKNAQYEMSSRLAAKNAELAFLVFSEFSRHLKHLHPDHQRNMIAALLPWMKAVKLQVEPEGGVTGPTYMLLANLVDITIKCSSALPHETQALWQALATGPYAGNVQLILDFIISLSLNRSDENFVKIAKQIVVFLSGTAAGQKVIDFLLQQIGPTTMVNSVERRLVSAPAEAKVLPFLADLSAVLPPGNRQSGIPLAQLCSILLVDLVVSPAQLTPDKVPTLLQVVVTSWDSNILVVQQQAREMLVHLVHELVISKLVDVASQTLMPSIEDFIELIRRNDPKVNWTYGDNSRRGQVAALPESMTFVVTEVVKFFEITHPGIESTWGRLTIDWACQCNVMHLACRSLQIYRCILKPMNKETLSAVFHRLSTTIGDDEEVPQVYSTEVLRTIGTIAAVASPANFQIFPQVFWLMCASLSSPVESEFAEALSMLDTFLDKLDLDDSTVLAVLIDQKPPDFEWPLEGLASLLYNGCKSERCLEKCLKNLDQLVKLSPSRIVGNDTRLLFTVLANLPGLSFSLGQTTRPPRSIVTAAALASLAERQGHIQLSRALEGIKNLRYRDSGAFLTECVTAIRLSFFPAQDLESLKFLLGLLSNKLFWFKAEVLQILSMLIQEVDMRKPRIANQGPELVAPLLRLLRTEFCQQALQALDNAMAMSGTAFDKHNLDISTSGSRSTRALLRDYDSTQSLYGIPEESGWSIPRPAFQKQLTRSNINSVVCAFGNVTPKHSADAVTPEVEFYNEEYLQSAHYVTRRGTMISDDATLAETDMGELVSKLDSLDDFFDGISPESASPPVIYDESLASMHGSYAVAGAQETYNERISQNPGNIARNESFASFTNTYDDVNPTPPREAVVMSPSAFSATRKLSRPFMLRSVTSPAVSQRTTPERQYIATTDETEPFSEDDFSAGRTSTSDRSFVDSFQRPWRFKQGFRSGVRSGFKRLASAHRSMSRHRPFEASPEVPKVPDVYLRNPKSSEL